VRRLNRSIDESILLVASAGGHMEQLLLLCEAWSQSNAVYITTRTKSFDLSSGAEVYVVPDANRYTPLNALKCFMSIAFIIYRTRPKCIISTGALPGGIAMFVGKLMGVKTIWIDSIANVERISLTGRFSSPFCDEFLTQWPHLALDSKPKYLGRVL